jgi:hypothetical protein
LGAPFDGQALAFAVVITGFILAFSLLAFGRLERSFADVI